MMQAAAVADQASRPLQTDRRGAAVYRAIRTGTVPTGAAKVTARQAMASTASGWWRRHKKASTVGAPAATATRWGRPAVQRQHVARHGAGIQQPEHYHDRGVDQPGRQRQGQQAPRCRLRALGSQPENRRIAHARAISRVLDTTRQQGRAPSYCA
jgi:hypothetical protein